MLDPGNGILPSWNSQSITKLSLKLDFTFPLLLCSKADLQPAYKRMVPVLWIQGHLIQMKCLHTMLCIMRTQLYLSTGARQVMPSQGDVPGLTVPA